MKHAFCVATGTICSFIAGLFGGWDHAVVTLVTFMAIDFITGLITAGVFHKSAKTENGALESRAGFKGLCRKVTILLCVVVAHRLDIENGSSYIRDGVCVAFSTNEFISIVENAGLMGIHIPPPLENAIELLKTKSKAKGKEKTE